MQKIFIIEDDAVLRESVTHIIELQGLSPVVCNDFARAAREALDACPDVVIVDLKIPDNDGLSVIRQIRTESSVPILVLTSSETEFDEIMSLRIGADDYLTKPYSPAVLLAHIERLLARAGQTDSIRIVYEGIELDISKSIVSYDGQTAELSRNEMRILNALMTAEGRILSRQELMYELWQSDNFIDDNTLTVNVNRLRRVLEGIGVPSGLLKTHRGQGYSL